MGLYATNIYKTVLTCSSCYNLVTSHLFVTYAPTKSHKSIKFQTVQNFGMVKSLPQYLFSYYQNDNTPRNLNYQIKSFKYKQIDY